MFDKDDEDEESHFQLCIKVWTLYRI